MKKLITLCLVLSGVAASAQQEISPRNGAYIGRLINYSRPIMWTRLVGSIDINVPHILWYEQFRAATIQAQKDTIDIPTWDDLKIVRLPVLSGELKWTPIMDSTEIVLPTKRLPLTEGEAFKPAPTVKLPHKMKAGEKPAEPVVLPHKFKKGEKTTMQLL